MRRALVVLFDHRADLLAAMVYLCLAYLSFNALADYANGHHLFPEPGGGWAFAVAIDGSVLYAFISFRRAQIMAGVLLVAGAVATYMLQRWHAQHAPHPLVVAGVVPGLMILVTFAWHRIREAEPAPATSQPSLARPAELPTLARTVPGSRERQPVTPVPRRASGPISGRDRAKVAAWVGEGRSARWIAGQLGLSNHARSAHLAPLIEELRRAPVGGPGPNGDGGI